MTNTSEKEQTINLTICKDKHFDCDTIFGPYNREELPFTYQDGSLIKNSEVEHNCWFIENPQTKELQKTLTVKLGPAGQ